MKRSFVEYFIRRMNTLPLRGEEIEFIAATPRGIRKLKLQGISRERHNISWFFGSQVFTVDGRYLTPRNRALFLVKRKDTMKHEDWLGDYQDNPDPDLGLLSLINRRRREQAIARRRAEGSQIFRKAEMP